MMNVQSVEALYLDDSGAISLSQLTELSGLSENELRELVECGAFSPDDTNTRSWMFSLRCVTIARNAHRLREDFALEDTHSLAIVFRFAQRIKELEGEIGRLRGVRK